MPTGAAIGAATLAGAYMSSRGAKNAAEASSDAGYAAAQMERQSALDSLALQQYMYDTARADSSPYRQVGTSALNQLAGLYGISPGLYETYPETPAYGVGAGDYGYGGGGGGGGGSYDPISGFIAGLSNIPEAYDRTKPAISLLTGEDSTSAGIREIVKDQGGNLLEFASDPLGLWGGKGAGTFTNVDLSNVGLKLEYTGRADASAQEVQDAMLYHAQHGTRPPAEYQQLASDWRAKNPTPHKYSPEKFTGNAGASAEETQFAYDSYYGWKLDQRKQGKPHDVGDWINAGRPGLDQAKSTYQQYQAWQGQQPSGSDTSTNAYGRAQMGNTVASPGMSLEETPRAQLAYFYWAYEQRDKGKPFDVDSWKKAGLPGLAQESGPEKGQIAGKMSGAGMTPTNQIRSNEPYRLPTTETMTLGAPGEPNTYRTGVPTYSGQNTRTGMINAQMAARGVPSDPMAEFYGSPDYQVAFGDGVYDRFLQSPDYQFAYDEGLRATRQNLARGGLSGSGRALKELTRYGQGMASQQLGTYRNTAIGQLTNYKNSLAALAGVGQTANQSTSAAGQNFANQGSAALSQIGLSSGNAARNAGDARASSYLANANIANNLINQGIGAYTMYRGGAFDGGGGGGTGGGMVDWGGIYNDMSV